jgi:hypothetical protein
LDNGVNCVNVVVITNCELSVGGSSPYTSTDKASKETYTYEGESNENDKSDIKIRNTARLSCKLTTMILVV